MVAVQAKVHSKIEEERKESKEPAETTASVMAEFA